ncbi:pyruvate/2-oxoglutarate dehydrogenase complex dihydrolipoamide acyltransferase (E2) component [Arthrobacter sp. JUb119]|nr:pyruvate/2-oxoglutarate dehydrogenase complex dihydrolipoamide acyltransferase (E2) component [Arthrobacter sp. JUb119]
MTSPHGVNSISTSGLPRGELLGRYTSYLDAQKLVDYLADNDFPVAAVSIVGNDVRTVERVTAKLSYPRVALAGAAQGGMMGLFVGLLLTLFGGGGNGLYQILSAIGLGMAIWMIAGVISYSTRRGKRDFASSSQFVATSFDVVVDFEHAQSARILASKLPMRPQQAPAQPVAQAPQQQPAEAAAPSAQAAAAVPATPAQPAAEEERSSQFPDLPDGRPRYGVRVNEAKPAAPVEPVEQPAKDEAQAPAAEAKDTQDLSQVEPRVDTSQQPQAPVQEPAPRKDPEA